MWKVVVMALLSALCQIYALNYSMCQETPVEKHCLIEYMVRARWPHQVRYVYNWHARVCFEIRWSNHCPPVSSPSFTNNFPTEKECLAQCGGWA